MLKIILDKEFVNKPNPKHECPTTQLCVSGGITFYIAQQCYFCNPPIFWMNNPDGSWVINKLPKETKRDYGISSLKFKESDEKWT